MPRPPRWDCERLCLPDFNRICGPLPDAQSNFGIAALKTDCLGAVVSFMPAMDLSPQLFAEINSCDYLLLREIAEPEENTLRLLLEEASPERQETTIEVAGTMITGGHRVLSNERSRCFELLWDGYIAYSVINESYCAADQNETSDGGRHCRIYSESRFLDFLSRATFAKPEYPGPFKHASVLCENHIVDVASTTAPRVRSLPPGSLLHSWETQ
jgi:hypothetical protein